MLARPKLAWMGRRIGILMGGLAVAACSTATPTPTPTATPRPTRGVTPFLTATPSPTPRARPVVPTPTEVPPPTPTPFTYQVVAGDTLSAIAFRFGVTVEEIQTANPGVNPQLLSIGTDLIIPVGEAGARIIPSPTPVRVITGTPQCYPTAEGGLWCFLPLLNEQPRPLENPTAEMILYDQGGDQVAVREAQLPVNLIPPGEALPLVAYFPPQVPPGVIARGSLRGTYLLPEGDSRYLPARLDGRSVVISPDGSQATVRGRVELEIEGEAEKSLVWVLAVAHGANQEVVGIRRWEREVTLAPGARLPFQATVYSLGPPITRVEVLAEVQRLPGP